MRLFYACCQVDRLVRRGQVAVIQMARNHVDVDVKDVLAGRLVVLSDGRAGCMEGVLDCLSRPADTAEELGVECRRKVVEVAEVPTRDHEHVPRVRRPLIARGEHHHLLLLVGDHAFVALLTDDLAEHARGHR